ncbi:MAG: DUF1648 domain-containing protein [Candidatus Jorgensenbacteria bacterium]
MKFSKSEITVLLIVLVSFAVGAYVYPMLPERVASHWNAQGEVNGTMPRFWGAFLMPLISVVLLAVFVIVPRVDPKRENIEKFRKYFDAFIIVLFLFFFYLHGLTLAWNFGYQFAIIPCLLPALAALFFSMGIMLSYAEPNWTIGIRTPWTLSSETVWRKTHALGGNLLKAAGLLMIAGMFLPGEALYFLFVPVLMAVLIPVACSYFWYRDEKRQG